MLKIRDARVPATSVDIESPRSKGSLFEKVHPFVFLKMYRVPVWILSSVRTLCST